MTRDNARLSAFAKLASPDRKPQVFVVFSDDDAAHAVAFLRVARNWPDDLCHPVQAICVRWGAG